MECLDQWHGDTLVLVASMRGKNDLCQARVGLGGIPAGKLLDFDLQPSGQTFLWQRLATLLEQLQTVAFSNARILLLDLSGSMSSQVPILKRMWAAIPTQGLICQGLEIMVVTDGHDNESEGPFAGSQGLHGLITKATELGWDCNGQGPKQLHVTLLDVGNGSVSKALAELEPNQTFLCTHDVDLVASILRQPMPRVNGLIMNPDQHWQALPAQELDQIRAVERYLNPGKKAHLDLAQMLTKALGPNPLPQAKSTVLSFLRSLINDQKLLVDRRGEYKAFHTPINSMLYQLQDFGVFQSSGSPPIWSKGVMWAFILDQLEQLEEVKEITLDQLLGLPEKEANDYLDQLSPSACKRVCNELLASKRQKL